MEYAWGRIVILGLLAPMIFVKLAAQGKSIHEALPDIVSLCQVVEHPNLYNGKMIRFRAIASTDGFESSSLSDPECNRGVSPWSSEESDKKKEVNSFNKAMEAQSTKHVHDTISAVFWGRFEYAPDAENVTRRMLFEIRGVKDLKVSNRR